MTIESDIETALFDRVTSLSLTPPLPIAWPNVDYTPPTDGLYLAVQHFPNGVSRYSQTGADPKQRIGILQLTVVTPLNQGASNATLIAGQIAEHFPADLIMRSGAVKVTVTDAPSIAPAIKTDASWDTPLSIPYFSNA